MKWSKWRCWGSAVAVQRHYFKCPLWLTSTLPWTLHGLNWVTHRWWLSLLCFWFRSLPCLLWEYSSRSWWRAAGFPPLRWGWWRSCWAPLRWPGSSPARCSTPPRVLQSTLPWLKCWTRVGYLLSAMCQELGGKSRGESSLKNGYIAATCPCVMMRICA